MDKLDNLLLTLPKYRRDQIYSAWFNPTIASYAEISTLPVSVKQELENIPWITVRETNTAVSASDYTHKTLFTLEDGQVIESVLMGRENKKQDKKTDWRYTICISTQVGCAMGCVFCATGKMGFKRNLTYREIVDQYRAWSYWLKNNGGGRIENIVLMGQGEPLLNYENVKTALNILLKYTDIGPRQMTLSTVGVKPGMERLVADPEFPGVRFALSLHSAIPETRQQMIPSHPPDFLTWLPAWAETFHKRFPGRNHFLGLEYTLVQGENDDSKHLRALIKLASKLGLVRINLIPCNTGASIKTGTERTVIEEWQKKLMAAGFTTTIRRSQGQDIMAACGQLANKC